MFNKVLIANRGEIALRVIRACKELGIRTVAVYSEADEASLHVKFADEAICIGPSIPKKSYLNIPSIISAAELTNSDAIHPGYGFLSESSEFCKICEEHNIRFIGPSPETIDLMGDKSQARKFANSFSVPVIPGTKQPVLDVDEANLVAEKIGFPVILKAVSGGGGKGMRVVEAPDDMQENLTVAKNEALNAFKDDQIYIEKFLINLENITISRLSDNTTYIIESVQTEVEKFQNTSSDEDLISKKFAAAKMNIQDLQLPPNFDEEMGNTVEQFSFNVSIFGHIPTGDSDTPVQIWRDDGGTMEINSFHCRWGPLEIDTSGTVALDGEMRPIGSLTADIKGYGDVIDAMIMSNIIPLGDAFLAKVAFNMMADKPEDGGPRVLRSIPVIAQDGELFVGPVSVGKLPVLSLK